VSANFIGIDSKFRFPVGFDSVFQCIDNVVAGDVLDAVVFPNGGDWCFFGCGRI